MEGTPSTFSDRFISLIFQVHARCHKWLKFHYLSVPLYQVSVIHPPLFGLTPYFGHSRQRYFLISTTLSLYAEGECKSDRSRVLFLIL